jgi:hypothetical protein
MALRDESAQRAPAATEIVERKRAISLANTQKLHEPQFLRERGAPVHALGGGAVLPDLRAVVALDPAVQARESGYFFFLVDLAFLPSGTGWPGNEIHR